MTRILCLIIPLLLGPALAVAAEDAPAITWLSHEEGITTAERSGRMMLIDFSAEWCHFCKKMDEEVFTDPEVIRLINAHFTPIRVDTDKEKMLARLYGIEAMPTFWFLESDATRLSPLQGYVKADRFSAVLRYMHTRAFETLSFQDFLAAEDGTK